MLSSRLVSPSFRAAILAIAFVLVPLSLLGVHVLIAGEFYEVRSYRSTAEETVETRNDLKQLLAVHLDVETAVRGYVITDDPTFLRPYLAAIPKRDAYFVRLSRNADAERLAQLDTLIALSDEKLAISAGHVDQMRAGNAEIARQQVAAGRGQETMEAIRQLVADIDAEESAKLSELTRAGTVSSNEVERYISLLLVGLVVLLAFVTMLIGNSIRERARALDRVEQLAKRQKAMFDGAVDGMLWLDEEGRILRMNPSISRMFGYSERELVGQHNIILMDTDYTLQESMGWLATIGAAGADGAGRRQEFVGKRANGSTFETEIAISRVEDANTDKGAPRFVVSIRDISQRKRVERMKTEFVSTVSHELRTPLTSIGGSLGLVMGGAAGPLEDKTRRLLGIAHSNCERLIRLINDILDIEKIESGKMDFDIRRMQVGPMVRRTIDAVTGFAETRDVRLAIEMPPWPQCIMGDPDRLDQLLTNLVSNAIKHSPAGETVEIFCHQQGGLARIEVRDKGEGIPTSFRDRIFGKFAMADATDSRTKGGSGLGLSIAREIARRHGGDVGYTDRPGGGTIFHCDIPLAREQVLEDSDSDAGLPAVLHLDDDADCLSVVASAFAGKARVVSVSTLRDARWRASKEDLSAIIIDVGLGGENGLSLIDQLGEAERRLPVVVFTAIDEASGVADVDRLLVKSRASVEDLVDATMALIARREREAA